MKIFEQFPHIPRVTDREIGIEVEAEGNNLWPNMNGNRKYVIGAWNVTTDGSLRGNGGENAKPAEYVLAKPIKRADVKKTLRELVTFHKEANARLDNSDRAGVHIHLNVQDLTVAQAINVIILYCVFEDMLVRYCGESREGNLFCLRARDAEAFVDILRKCKREETLIPFQSDQYRYASINVSALKKYGTLEFRSFRTPQNLMDIQHWVNLLLCIKDAGAAIKESRDIVDSFSQIGAGGFLTRVFGQHASLLDGPANAELMMEGVRRIQDVAYTKVQKKDSKSYVFLDHEQIRANRFAGDGERQYANYSRHDSDAIIRIAKDQLRQEGNAWGETTVSHTWVVVIPQIVNTANPITINGDRPLPPQSRARWVLRTEFGRDRAVWTKTFFAGDREVPEADRYNSQVEPYDYEVLNPVAFAKLTRPCHGYLRTGWVMRFGNLVWARDILPQEDRLGTDSQVNPLTFQNVTNDMMDVMWWNEPEQQVIPDPLLGLAEAAPPAEPVPQGMAAVGDIAQRLGLVNAAPVRPARRGNNALNLANILHAGDWHVDVEAAPPRMEEDEEDGI